MKLLEYETKAILRASNVSVPVSYTANVTPEFLPTVIKSQVPIGGRGKAGGVRIVRTTEEYTQVIRDLRALPIKGYLPKTLLAEEVLEIERELYLALMIDQSTREIILMAHHHGGVEVEDNSLSDFLHIAASPQFANQAGEQLAEYFDLPKKTFILQELVKNLYTCFITQNATLLEINPLICTTDGRLIAGDGKMELDDAAAFRHPEWSFETAIAETNFVTLDPNGTVATIANGAGLAMATVDAVVDCGMKPANFLDIGGGANEAGIVAAFERIMQHPQVSVIIINIFAGITRCDEVARAVIAARNQINSLPTLSIRLTGTNSEQAIALLSAENIPILATLDECIAVAKGIVS